MRTISTLTFGLALLAAIATSPALASSCGDDVASLNKTAQETALEAEQKAQVLDMLKQAADLCAAGNEDASLDVIAEVKALLDLR